MMDWMTNHVGDLTIKVTFVLLATAVSAVALRHATAAARHRVWTVGVATALLLIPTILLFANQPLVVSVPAFPVPATPMNSDGPSMAAVLWFVWGTGASIILVLFTMGVMAARRLVKNASPITDPNVTRFVQEQAARVGLQRRVAVSTDAKTAVPVVWGVTRPTIVLPAYWRSWSREMLGNVLAHELAHVVRFDLITRWMATLAKAVYWFHPLAWLAERQIRVESERACDAIAAECDGDAERYAEHLVELARRAPWRASTMGAPAMARWSGLRTRVEALMHNKRLRPGPKMTVVLVGASIALACVSVTSFEPDERVEEVPTLRVAGASYRATGTGGTIRRAASRSRTDTIMVTAREQPVNGRSTLSPVAADTGVSTIQPAGRFRARADTTLVFISEQSPGRDVRVAPAATATFRRDSTR